MLTTGPGVAQAWVRAVGTGESQLGEAGLLDGVKRRVDWSEHGHGADQVPVPAVHVDIAEAVVHGRQVWLAIPFKLGAGMQGVSDWSRGSRLPSTPQGIVAA